MIRFRSMRNNMCHKFTAYIQGDALIVSPNLLFPVRVAPEHT